MAHDNQFNIEALEAVLHESLAPIRDSLQQLTDTVNFLSEKFDSIEKRISMLESKTQDTVKENKFLKAEVLRLSNVLNDLNGEINELEQYSRRDCCEISGIPELPSENTTKLVTKIGSLMGLKIDKTHISVSHRLPKQSYSSRLSKGTSSSNRNRSPVSQHPKVIVKFVRREIKDLFYESRKNLRGKSTSDLGLSRISDNEIYISESLTKRNSKLFKDCLSFKREHGFKFIWTQQG